MKKGSWEKRKIKQANQNSKILWDVVREISGNTRNKDEQIYLYRKDMTRHRALQFGSSAFTRQKLPPDIILPPLTG